MTALEASRQLTIQMLDPFIRCVNTTHKITRWAKLAKPRCACHCCTLGAHIGLYGELVQEILWHIFCCYFLIVQETPHTLIIIMQVADLQQECKQMEHDIMIVLESQESQDSKKSQ